MDKAIILGVYGFIGFHLCKEILEKGFEVTGIHLDHSNDRYIEEKRMEIGRNANFTEKIIEEWEGEDFEDDSHSLIIFSLYDYLIGTKEISFNYNCMWNQMKQDLDKRQFVFLVPIQLLAETDHGKEMNELFENIRGIRKGWQVYYLPSIFGPWQPETFLFQKSLLNILKEEREENGIKEWKMDAIFVEDAVKTLMANIESEVEGHFLLESGVNNQWEACADLLEIDQQFRRGTRDEDFILNEQITRLPVEAVTPISEAISKQKKHVDYLSII
jgi:hypothetical protein